MPAGYSGTPLAKKLGLKAGAPLWASGMPASVKAEIDREAQPRYLARPTKARAVDDAWSGLKLVIRKTLR